MSDLKRAAIRGTFWSALSTFFSRGLRFFITIILARLLVPEDFGLVAMSMLVVDVAQMLSDLGLGAALIQRKKLDPEHLTTCFWANQAVGLILWAITFFGAPLAAVFYKTPAVQPVLATMALTFIFAPMGSIHWVILNRELRFKELMIAQSIATAVRGGTSLFLAWHGSGVWSLVWGPIAGNVAGTAANWMFCTWRPNFSWSGKHFRELFHYGKNVFGSKLLGYFTANTDYLITGRVLGASVLGVYNFAYQLPHLSETHIAPIVNRVLFPVLSQVQDDHQRFRRGYMMTLRWMAIAAVPFAIGLGVTAPEFIRVVYGEQWLGVIVPLQILCSVGLAHALTSTVWTVTESLGRPDIGLKWNALTLPFIVGALVVSARWGITGIAVTMLCVGVITSGLIQHIMNRLAKLSWREEIRVVSPAFGAAALMGLAVHALRVWLHSRGLPDGWILGASAAAGAMVYTVMLFALDRTLADELRHVASFRKAQAS